MVVLETMKRRDVRDIIVFVLAHLTGGAALLTSVICAILFVADRDTMVFAFTVPVVMLLTVLSGVAFWSLDEEDDS